jgi:hypothetical protein
MASDDKTTTRTGNDPGGKLDKILGKPCPGKGGNGGK